MTNATIAIGTEVTLTKKQKVTYRTGINRTLKSKVLQAGTKLTVIGWAWELGECTQIVSRPQMNGKELNLVCRLSDSEGSIGQYCWTFDNNNVTIA
jgi:hypothetical protein